MVTNGKVVYTEERYKLYHVYFGVVNYKIVLDENSKICSLQVGNDLPYLRKHFVGYRVIDHIESLTIALKYMLVDEPEKFSELYITLKYSDPEMFVYAKKVVDEIGGVCMKLVAD